MTSRGEGSVWRSTRWQCTEALADNGFARQLFWTGAEVRFHHHQSECPRSGVLSEHAQTDPQE